MTYQDLIHNLKSTINFSFARYGDGEFNAIFGASKGQRKEKNCDGHKYFKAMGMRLYKVLLSRPNYIMGMQPMALRLRVNDKNFHNLVDGIQWVDADMIHKASIKGGLHDLFEALKMRNIILVANEDLTSIAMEIGGSTQESVMHIVISPVDVWHEYDDILKRLKEIVRQDDVILYCASMPTEILIDDIYNLYGDQVTQIDIGSAFDPYCGIKSRSYHKKLRI